MSDLRGRRPFPALTVIAGLLALFPRLYSESAPGQPCSARRSRTRWERFEATHHLSRATAIVLARHELIGDRGQRPGRRGPDARSEELAVPAEPDGALALAELSYQAGLSAKTAPQAGRWPGTATRPRSAWLALADPAGTRPDLALADPQRRRGPAGPRLAGGSAARAATGGRCWRSRGSPCLRRPLPGTRRSSPTCGWRPTSESRGWTMSIGRSGLGVPLIAHRVVLRNRPGVRPSGRVPPPRPADRGHRRPDAPAGACPAATGDASPATLVLLDPFGPLEPGDRTAYRSRSPTIRTDAAGRAGRRADGGHPRMDRPVRLRIPAARRRRRAST